MINFYCLECGMKFQVKDEFTGRSTRCPTCKQPLKVPEQSQTKPASPVGSIAGSDSSLAKTGGGATVTLAYRPNEDAPVGDLLDASTPAGSRYVIDKEIARGGMGAVLRGIDRDIRREVAIKYMLDDRDPRKKTRFVEEAQITGQLEHPNIVPVHELGVDAHNRLFFTMKMVRGRSLKEILDNAADNPAYAESWSVSRLLKILVNVCHALAYAHARKVIHRDLKPANIMVGDFGEVYVMDWGLAKVLGTQGTQRAGGVSDGLSSVVGSTISTSREEEGDLTQDGTVLGTLAYMPPEQAMGDVHAIDQRSDIYSLGAILYAVLTLETPIEKIGDQRQFLLRVVDGNIVRPERRAPQRHVVPELSAITMKALAKEPKDRYQTVEAFRHDIELYLEGRSVSAKHDSAREQLVKFVKRNKGLSSGLSVALVVLVGSLVFLFFAWRETSNAYAAYEEAQTKKEEAVRHSLPALVRAGRQLANEGDIGKAEEQVELALSYDPDNASALLFKGQVALARQQWDDARTAFKRHLAKNPHNADVRQMIRELDRLRAEDPTSFYPLCVWLQQENLTGLAQPLLRALAQDVNARKQLLPEYQKQIDAAHPELGKWLHFDSQGFLVLRTGPRNEIVNLRFLQGIPLNVLEVRSNRLEDLSPLHGMPLEELDLLACTSVKRIDALRGMPLRRLNLGSHGAPMQIDDLEPLRGMKLETLIINQSSVMSLEPLRRMPLRTLNIAQTRVTDLEPLRGMPLKSLKAGSYMFDSLEPLRGMPSKTWN